MCVGKEEGGGVGVVVCMSNIIDINKRIFVQASLFIPSVRALKG